MNLELLLKNSRVLDGNGNPWYKADVGIKKGKIKLIDRMPDNNHRAEKTIDLEETILCPGFIDIHSHGNCNFLADSEASSKLRQGVTTELVGNCGWSAVPLDPESDFSERISDAIGEIDWENFSELFSRLEENGLPINRGSLVGHGSLRSEIMGFGDREPNTKELDQMKELLDRYMKEGVFGMSTGLYYAPGSYASTKEIIELAKIVSNHGGIYASHIRNERKNLIQSVKEAIQIGEEAELPVEISHHKAIGKENWGKVDESLKIIRKARRKGIDVTCEQYPYNASSTSLSALLPRWAQRGGKEKWLARLKDKEESAKIKKEMGGKKVENTDWSSIIIVDLPEENDENLIGKSIQDIARERNTKVLQTIIDLLVESKGEARHIHFCTSKDDIKKVMAKSFVMIGSDGSSLKPEGPLSYGKPHPRSYGTFPRVLSKYVGEENTLSLEDAVKKMTSLPAQKMGLKERGQIREGMDADLVAFSPEEIEDKATFEEPHQYPEGIYHVVVNGKLAVKNKKSKQYGAGKILKSGTN